MAQKRPKQSPGCHQGISALARRIKTYLQRLGMSQKELAAASGMPEARVSRISRGGQVRLTEQDINQLALGLEMTTTERGELRYLAWPELYGIDEALKRRDGCMFRINCELVEEGLSLSGSSFEE